MLTSKISKTMLDLLWGGHFNFSHQKLYASKVEVNALQYLDDAWLQLVVKDQAKHLPAGHHAMAKMVRKRPAGRLSLQSVFDVEKHNVKAKNVKKTVGEVKDKGAKKSVGDMVTGKVCASKKKRDSWASQAFVE